MGAGAGGALVVIDQAQVRAGASASIGCTRVGGCKTQGNVESDEGWMDEGNSGRRGLSCQ